VPLWREQVLAEEPRLMLERELTLHQSAKRWSTLTRFHQDGQSR
jgi:hypothetical protein